MQSQVGCPRRISGINPALWCPVFFFPWRISMNSRWIDGDRERNTVGGRGQSVATRDRVSTVERSNADRDIRDLATSIAAFYDINCTWARLRWLYLHTRCRVWCMSSAYMHSLPRIRVSSLSICPALNKVCDDTLRHLIYSLAKSVREEKRSLKVFIIICAK